MIESIMWEAVKETLKEMIKDELAEFDGTHCPQCQARIRDDDPSRWGPFREEFHPNCGNGVRAGTADYYCACGYVIEDVDVGS